MFMIIAVFFKGHVLFMENVIVSRLHVRFWHKSNNIHVLRMYAQSLIRDVPLTPYFHLTDGNLTKDTYNVLRRL